MAVENSLSFYYKVKNFVMMVQLPEFYKIAFVSNH